MARLSFWMRRAGRNSMNCSGAVAEPAFYAFDVPWLDGEDLRERPLIERKDLLRNIIPERPSVLL